MDDKDLKIGLAFSGGGFRASSFSLGVLSYLNTVTFNDTTLLKKVYVLSTVSGGTIAGARYALGIKKKESFDEIYRSLYEFMSEADLVNITLNNLIAKRAKNDTRSKSLIVAFADAYNEYLFNHERFGKLLNNRTPIHLKHISFNATEFTNALQFRFQKTEKIKNPKPDEPNAGIIGNYYYRIPEKMARDIRMADILAASSCFPGGFEPINFPDDFDLTQTPDLEKYTKTDKFPVGLMDGGIVDNQGIEPLLLAEQRMEQNRETTKDKNERPNELDLLIISDVTSPYMESYKASKSAKLNFWGRLNFRKLLNINHVVLLLSLVGVAFSIHKGIQVLDVVFSILITLNLILYSTLAIIKKLPRSFQVPSVFLKPFGKLLKVKFAVYENMILNRSNSLLKMTGDVFLKHIRRLNYNKIYQDESWKNRRIMNAIYELRKEEEKLQKKIKDKKLPKELIPSQAIQEVASMAASMGTTLWFTKEELSDKNMLNSIIACGQFTMCWNLLEYIHDIKKDAGNTNENHKKLVQIEKQILQHWRKFNNDPFWLVREYNRT